MQSVITHHTEDMGVTLLSVVFQQGTTTQFSPLCPSYVSKADDMTTCASMDMVFYNVRIYCTGIGFSSLAEDPCYYKPMQ